VLWDCVDCSASCGRSDYGFVQPNDREGEKEQKDIKKGMGSTIAKRQAFPYMDIVYYIPSSLLYTD